MKLFWKQDISGGQNYYRTISPVKFLRKYVKNLEIEVDECISSLDYDWFLYHRINQPPTYLKKIGKKIIWELDDDIWNIPEWSPAYESYNHPEVKNHANWFLENADEIIVSTEPLAKLVQEKTKQLVTILPNLIDLELWTNEPKPHDDFRIILAISPYHEKDLELIIEPLEQILKDFNNVKIFFIGDLPTAFAEFSRIRWQNYGIIQPAKRYQNKIEFYPFQSIDIYYKMLLEINADISLAPLFPYEFANSKSNVKYLEGSLAGSVTLATNSLPYQNTKAILIENDQWYNKIKYLINNKKEKIKIAKESKKDVLENYTWQSSSEKWINFFKGIK